MPLTPCLQGGRRPFSLSLSLGTIPAPPASLPSSTPAHWKAGLGFPGTSSGDWVPPGLEGAAAPVITSRFCLPSPDSPVDKDVLSPEVRHLSQ